jgi:hypothetical protein
MGLIERTNFHERYETFSHANQQIIQQYQLTAEMLDLVNNLIGRWGLASTYSYRYRQNGSALNVKLLDLDSMNA